MIRRRVSFLAALGLLALGACTTAGVVPPGTNPDTYKSAAAAAQSDTGFIPPTDPRYSENGAPRAGEPTGVNIAGDPRLIGDGKTYAPIYHRNPRY